MDGPSRPAPLRVLDAIAGVWAKIRAWRRIRFTAGGAAFTAGTMPVIKPSPKMNTSACDQTELPSTSVGSWIGA